MTQKKQSLFTRMAMAVAKAAGRPATFAAAAGIVVIWAASGPVFGFGDTWQLVINTGTTIVTFLMVFLIQNTQNRDTEAMQIKLDELIYAMKGANAALLDLEELDEKSLDVIRRHYLNRAAEAREKVGDTGLPGQEADHVDR
ncbi:low affinity iron permease family protein [Luteibacter sp. 9135]|uniref:low affinity iron permease family protein n=1 Tax=Luteibacter sp. 9135 TaxID=1500893 RepID=UPI00055A00B7|nr:low affinity iron permease family protein [Luteibacter sp. 9135]